MDDIERALRRSRITVESGMSQEEIGQQIVDSIRAQGVDVPPEVEIFLKMPLIYPETMGSLSHVAEMLPSEKDD